MKKLRFKTASIAILLVITTSIFAQKQPKFDEDYFSFFPSYEDLIEVYFSANEFDYSLIGKTKFAKKTDGWYVIFLDDKFNEAEERLIWNAETAMFTNIKNDALEDGGNEAVEQGKQHFLRGYSPMWFEQYPVYGYQGYEDDVINLLENEENLSAGLLDALARSYSSKGMETINPGQYGGKKKVMEYDRTFKAKDWDEATLKTFMKYADKSIATFKILSDTYPDYQTVVGDIKMKYRNEHMSAYYVLKFSGRADLGEKYLIDNLYNDYQIKTASNYLNTCASNAILFTAGDNDTYPLIYVQDKLGVRTDVKVINTSLANLGRYIHFLKSAYNLPTTLPIDEYKLEKNNYILIKNELEDVDLRDYFKALSEDDDLYTDETSGVHYMPASTGFWVIQPKPLGFQLGVAKRLSEPAAYFLFSRSYLLKGEVFMLDLLTTDNWQTPVYFTNGGYFTIQGLGMTDYVKVEGLAYRFLPKGTHDAQLLEDNLLSAFEYGNVDEVNWWTSDNYINFAFYQMGFKELLENQRNNLQKVTTTLDKIQAVFPHEKVSYQSEAASLADFCYDLELYERGDAFIKNEVDHIHLYFKSIQNKAKDELTFFEQQTVNRMLYTASQLVTIAEINEREVFRDLATWLSPYSEQYGE